MRTILTSLLLFTGIASGTLQAGQIDEELADGIRVNAIYEPAEPGKPVVLLIHPLQQTYHFSTIAGLADNLTDNGYGLLTPNLSLGISNRKQSLECEAIHSHTLDKDIDEIGFWINWLKRTTDSPIVAMGHSTGALQVLGYRDDAQLQSMILISLVTIGPFGAAAIDTAQLEMALTDRQQGNPNRLGQYKFSYCNNYVTTRDTYLDLATWDDEKVSAQLRGVTIPVHIILADEDYAQHDRWLSNLELPNLQVHRIEGGNHFFSGTREFELHDKVIEILEESQ
jgi:alpha-beta hydrolase superfamily lysophospholipase